MRPIKYAEIRRFLRVDGWEDRDKIRGATKGDHHRYVKILPDGRKLYTRVSHGTGQYDDPALIARILRDEFEVSEEQFWETLRTKVPPDRGTPESSQSARKDPLPAWLAMILIVKVGVPESEVAELTPERAEWAWEYWQAHGEYPPPDEIGAW